jgi:hypothetical protein
MERFITCKNPLGGLVVDFRTQIEDFGIDY